TYLLKQHAKASSRRLVRKCLWRFWRLLLSHKVDPGQELQRRLNPDDLPLHWTSTRHALHVPMDRYCDVVTPQRISRYVEISFEHSLEPGGESWGPPRFGVGSLGTPSL